MIKQTWEISNEEKNRIISLHESATNNFYLMSEQVEVTEWNLRGYVVSKEGGRYYVMLRPDTFTEIPTIEELSIVIEKSKSDRNKLVPIPSELTQNALTVGESMKDGSLRVGSVGNTGKETLEGSNLRYCAFSIERNAPEFGQISFRGNLYRSGVIIHLKKVREKIGTTITFDKNYTDQFNIQLNDLSIGPPSRKDQPTPIIPPIERPKIFSFDIESPFDFDKTDLTPEAEKNFKEFIENIKKFYSNVSGDVTVTTSSSIDSDPSTKEQYNMELSKRRAQIIIDRLKRETGNKTLNFIPNPIGQTDQFAKGMKFPEVRDTNKTAPNRRLIIKLPEISQ